MFELFVGDISPDLSNIAKNYDPTAYLIDRYDPKQHYQGTAYSSLGDINDPRQFTDLCNSADIVHYAPPNQWSDWSSNTSVQQEHTESILLFLSQTKTVIGLDAIKHRYSFIKEIPGLIQRPSHGKNLWAVGCSISHGIGVSIEESWPQLVANALCMPLIRLTQPGSSIIWASDQICQQNIQPGDLVFWGLTVQNRLDVIDRYGQIVHLNPSSYEKNHGLLSEFPISLLDNRSLIYHNVLAVRRAKNFCDKAGATLITCGLTFDLDKVYNLYGIENFRQILCWPNHYLDLGSDGSHPGSLQHQEYAKSFLEIYQSCK